MRGYNVHQVKTKTKIITQIHLPIKTSAGLCIKKPETAWAPHLAKAIAVRLSYLLSVEPFKNMSLRQLTKEAKKGLSKALFYFPQEMKTGIAPTRLILNSDKIIPLKEGISVTVNWGGKKVQAEILALDGK